MAAAVQTNTASKIHDSLKHGSVIQKQKYHNYTTLIISHIIKHLIRSAIEKLRDENNKLKEEIMLANKFSRTTSKDNLSLYILKLQEEADTYTRKVLLFNIYSLIHILLNLNRLKWKKGK